MKVRDVTPAACFCIIGACPRVLETERDTYLIVGKRLERSMHAHLPPGVVGDDEEVVEVPRGLIDGIPESGAVK